MSCRRRNDRIILVEEEMNNSRKDDGRIERMIGW